ncbi:hypothetical protein F4808DRAFT_370855 [Astrocystis sublimbata]|nr:hypothetical protein F4808DRAFT_370855 [Astrocystis sublimbata]
MKFTIATLSLAAFAQAASISGYINSTTSSPIYTTMSIPTYNTIPVLNTTSTTMTTTTTTSSPTPTPTGYNMTCGGSLGDLCHSLCSCGGGDVNCHADPTSKCIIMCKCKPEYAGED